MSETKETLILSAIVFVPLCSLVGALISSALDGALAGALASIALAGTHALLESGI